MIIIERLSGHTLTKKQITGNKIRNEFLGIFNNEKYRMKPKYSCDQEITEYYDIMILNKKKRFYSDIFEKISEIYFPKDFDYIDIQIQTEYFNSLSELIVDICQKYKKQQFQITEVEEV